MDISDGDAHQLVQEARRRRDSDLHLWDQKRAMLAWAATHRLVRSTSSFTGLAWIADGSGRHARKETPALLPRPAFAWDHVSYWKQQETGTRMIVSQPYDCIPPAEEQTVRYEDHEYRLCWHQPSWYGLGTTLIVILATSEPQRFAYDGTLAEPNHVSNLWRIHYRGTAETTPQAPLSLDMYIFRILRLQHKLEGNAARCETERIMSVAGVA